MSTSEIQDCKESSMPLDTGTAPAAEPDHFKYDPDNLEQIQRAVEMIIEPGDLQLIHLDPAFVAFVEGTIRIAPYCSSIIQQIVSDVLIPIWTTSVADYAEVARGDARRSACQEDTYQATGWIVSSEERNLPAAWQPSIPRYASANGWDDAVTLPEQAAFPGEEAEGSSCINPNAWNDDSTLVDQAAFRVDETQESSQGNFFIDNSKQHATSLHATEDDTSDSSWVIVDEVYAQGSSSKAEAGLTPPQSPKDATAVVGAIEQGWSTSEDTTINNVPSMSDADIAAACNLMNLDAHETAQEAEKDTVPNFADFDETQIPDSYDDSSKVVSEENSNQVSKLSDGSYEKAAKADSKLASNSDDVLHEKMPEVDDKKIPYSAWALHDNAQQRILAAARYVDSLRAEDKLLRNEPMIRNGARAEALELLYYGGKDNHFAANAFFESLTQQEEWEERTGYAD